MNTSISLRLDAPCGGVEHSVDVDANAEFGEITLHDVVLEDDYATARTILLYSAADAIRLGEALIAAARGLAAAREREQQGSLL